MDLMTYAYLKRFVSCVYLNIFSLWIIFNRLKICAKQIRFTAHATLQVYAWDEFLR